MAAKVKSNGVINGSESQTTSKIEAIKELIFGENIQAYDNEFTRVKKDILAKKEELENLIDDIKSELNKSLDSLDTDLNIRITDLEDSINSKLETLDNAKVSRNILSDMFINLGNKLKD